MFCNAQHFWNNHILGTWYLSREISITYSISFACARDMDIAQRVSYFPASINLDSIHMLKTCFDIIFQIAYTMHLPNNVILLLIMKH